MLDVVYKTRYPYCYCRFLMNDRVFSRINTYLNGEV